MLGHDLIYLRCELLSSFVGEGDDDSFVVAAKAIFYILDEVIDKMSDDKTKFSLLLDRNKMNSQSGNVMSFTKKLAKLMQVSDTLTLTFVLLINYYLI